MHSRARRRGPRPRGIGTVAGRTAVLPVVVLAIGLMLAAHAPVLDVLTFTGFVLVGITLPGFVLWRLVGGYRRNLVEDCAAGFAVGVSVQLIVYLASASVGLQRWSWAWVPVVLVLGILDTDVRARVWRRVEAPLAPLTAWLLSGSSALVLVVLFLTGPGPAHPGVRESGPGQPRSGVPPGAGGEREVRRTDRAAVGVRRADEVPHVLPPVRGCDLVGDRDRPDPADLRAALAAARAGRLCAGFRADPAVPDAAREGHRRSASRGGVGRAAGRGRRGDRRDPPAAAQFRAGRGLAGVERLCESAPEPRRHARAAAGDPGRRPAPAPATEEPLGAVLPDRAGRGRRQGDDPADGRLRVRAGLLRDRADPAYDADRDGRRAVDAGDLHRCLDRRVRRPDVRTEVQAGRCVPAVAAVRRHSTTAPVWTVRRSC